MISLDTALSLTCGSPVGMSALLSRLRPSLDNFTGLASSMNGDPPLVGQIHYKQGERSARIAFLAPSSASRSPALPSLLDGLAHQAGEWGAYHLLAEVEEYSPVFEALRRGGYSLYAWQRVWQLEKPVATANCHPGLWHPATSVQEVAVRNLYQSLVPPLVQSAEPLSTLPAHSLVYCQDGDIMGFVTATYGPQGVYLLPLFHPGVENVSGLLTSLLVALPRATELPLYLSVRSYMGWLETTLETFNCRAAPRQALMVKHLVTPQRVPVLNPHLAPLEKRQAEPTATIINNMSANVTHDPTSNN